MTPRQYNNVIYWVETMLGGYDKQYKHCPVDLYDPLEDRYSAFGVCLDLANHDRVNMGLFANIKPIFHEQSLDQAWFDARFGTNLNVEFLRCMNDATDNYFAVCAHLLNRCYVGQYQQDLHAMLVQAVKDFHREKGDETELQSNQSMRSSLAIHPFGKPLRRGRE